MVNNNNNKNKDNYIDSEKKKQKLTLLKYNCSDKLYIKTQKTFAIMSTSSFLILVSSSLRSES